MKDEKLISKNIDEVKRLRSFLGMSQIEFSIYVGVPARTIEDWESGKRNIKDYVLEAIKSKVKYDQIYQYFENIDKNI